MTQQRKSIALSPEEWENIQNLAKRYSICAPTGINAGHPSWRSLVKAIAKGDIQIVLMSQEFIDRAVKNELV